MLPRKRILFPLFVALTVTLQLMLPVLARADDSAPPVEPGTDVTVVPPLDTTPTVPEILAQAPQGTELVVLNTDGSLEPLVTQAAAEALATSDPVWCPELQSPSTDMDSDTPGIQNDCTIPYSDFTSLLADSSISGDGTIFIENGAYAGSETDITFDGFVLSSWGALTLQGGWDLNALSGTYDSLIGTSSFALPIFIVDWGHAVEINDLSVDLSSYGSSSYGLKVETSGAIDLSNVEVTGAETTGAYLVNNTGTGIVSIDTSDFSNNTGTGLEVYSNGSISLDRIDAVNNTAGFGAILSSGDSISVDTGNFSYNADIGLWVGTGSGDVTLNSVVADNNQYGAVVGTDEGNITITNSSFDNNTIPVTDPDEITPGFGLQAGTGAGWVLLDQVSATFNDIGAAVGSEDGAVTVSNSTFSNNLYVGLEAGTMLGTVTLTDVVANNNGTEEGGGLGAYLGNMDGPILVQSSTPGTITTSFDGNLFAGLQIDSTGTAPVTLNDVQASGNAHKGAYIEYYAPCGTTTGGVSVQVTGGLFQSNGAYGLFGMLGPEGQLLTSAPTIFGTHNGTPADSLYDLLVDTSVYPCPPTEQPKEEPKPYRVVELPETGAAPVEQNCSDYSGVVMILPGQDKATLNCPAVGSSTLTTLPQESLPGAIPQGTGFVSAFQFTLMDGDQPVTVFPPGGSLNLAFQLPEDAAPTDRYAILYWDPTARNGAGGWVELPQFMTRLDGSPLAFALHPQADPADGMRILSGTRTLGGYVKATVNFTGAFALIKK